MSDEAAWKLGKVKYEEPGYVIVRKTRGLGEFRGELKEGLDGVAGEWIKLNKSDLNSGGAGGSYDDTALWKEIADLNDTIDNLDIPDAATLATKDELAALQKQVTDDIADLKDHLDNHPSGGGDTTQIEEDIAALKESVADLETALETVEDGLAKEITDRQEADKDLQDQIDVINTQGYDDTELRGLISDEETARTEKDSDLQDQIDNINADGYDDTELRGLISDEETARTEADSDLQDQIDNINANGYDDTELRGLISDEETARVDGDKALQDQIDAIEEYDDTEVRNLIKTEKDKNDEQDLRLDALEAGGQGEPGEIVITGGQPYTTNAAFSNPSGPGQITIKTSGDNQSIKFWLKDKNGEDFAPHPGIGDEYAIAVWENGPDEDPTVIAGTIDYINEEGSVTTVCEMTLVLPDGETAVTVLGGKEALMGVSLGAEEPEPFDPTYLEEKDAEQDDRLNQIDLDQEAQNDRLDKIDEDQKTQDSRLTALEAGIDGGGDTGEFLAAEWKKGTSTNDGYFTATGNLNSDIFFSFNRKDASGVGQDLSVVEAGHVFVAESKNTGEWGKWEVTSNGGLEYGKYQIGTKSLESSSDSAWENQATYTFTFSDPSKVEEVFDPAELVERLDQIDEDQETQNDRLDQIDLDQEAQNARLDDLETSLGVSKKFNFTTIANQAFIGTEGVIHLSTSGSGKQFMKVNKKDASGNDVPKPEVGEPVKLGVDGQVIYFPVAYSSDTGSHWSINSAEDYTDGIKITEDGKDVELTFGEEEPETFDPTYLEEKDSEQDDRLDQIDEDQKAQDARLDALEAASDKFNFTTVSSSGRIDTEGAIYLNSSGGGKQLIMVNKKDNNGKDVPQPEVGDLVTLEVDGQAIYFPVDYTGNNGSNWQINSAADYTDGIRIYEDDHDVVLTFGGEEPYKFDPTYLEEKDAEQDDRLDKIDEGQEAQDKRLDTLEEVAYKPVAGVWKRTDNAATSGGMIGVSGFNAVSNIFLNFRDTSGEAFDFTGIEVGTILTITNTTNQDATGKYRVTYLEDKGTNWNIQVDILEGTGVLQKNENAEFSFGIPVEPLDTEKVVTVAEGQEGPLSIWRGTKAEYDAISDPSDDVLYVVLP